MMCGKCGKVSGILFLIFGILFLVENLTTWDFWGISWYAILFILLGLGWIGKSCCGDCKTCMPSSKKRK